ncbi:MAG: DcaP family trimeric outer membrane transporter, partial [Limisphaerales bacterium]
ATAQNSAELDQLKTTVSSMERTIQELKDKIRELEQRQGSVPRQVDPSSAVTATARPTPAPDSAPSTAAATSQKPAPSDLEDHTSAMKHRETVSGDNVAAPRPGNAPMDPTYAGFMPLFGTKSWIRLGGYAKVDAIFDSTRVSNPNKFVTAGIPVEGEADYGKSEEFTLHAKQTRLNLELRTPTDLGSLRVVYENDFFGSSASPDMSYNLRHFYGQIANFTVGQTWSAFFDPDAIPDTLDFEGPGMQTIVRQPQLRYTYSPGEKHHHFAFSVEQPKSDVGMLPATGSTRNVLPDLAGHWRWEGPRGHVQVGGLARALAYDNSTGPDDTAVGWGANVSGVLHTWGQDGVVARFTYGDGIGRYMQDLPGGSSAIALGSGELETLAAWGAMIGYRHFWSERWRSEVTYGYLELDNVAEMGAKAYDHTHYAQANLVWTPVKNFAVGLEYLFGLRETRDGSDGDNHRLQVSLQYKLAQ